MAIVFLTIYTIDHKLRIDIAANKLSAALSNDTTPFPVLNYPISPYLSAKAAIVQEADSQAVLFSKNPNLRFSTASTAKIMTALVALEYYQPDSIIIIKSYYTPGSGLNLQLSDGFYFRDLIYAMMLPSANDAAAAIADNYPGGRTGFVARMNEKAKELHLTDTHFSDGIGLDDDENYSTVVDMGRLSVIAMRNSTFAKVVGTHQKVIFNVNKTQQYALTNLNRLLGYDGVNGIKTGTTEGAGEVLVTSAEIKGRTFIIVTMNSQDRFGDTATLLDYISNNLSYVNP